MNAEITSLINVLRAISEKAGSRSGNVFQAAVNGRVRLGERWYDTSATSLKNIFPKL